MVGAFVGDFWKDSLGGMSERLQRMGTQFSLFDAPFVHKFSEMSHTPEVDLRTVLDGSLVQIEPTNAVSPPNHHKLSQSLQPPRHL